MKTFLYGLLLLILGITLLFIDFSTKAYVYYLLPYSLDGLFGRSLSIFQDVGGVDFAITLTMNQGAAWGLFSNFSFWLVLFRCMIVFALMLYFIFFQKERKKDIPLLMIIVGAIGNIVDFFLYGSVVDFLHFTFWGYHFPIFNVADSLISLGVLALILLSFTKKYVSKDLQAD